MRRVKWKQVIVFKAMVTFTFAAGWLLPQWAAAPVAFIGNVFWIWFVKEDK